MYYSSLFSPSHCLSCSSSSSSAPPPSVCSSFFFFHLLHPSILYLGPPGTDSLSVLPALLHLSNTRSFLFFFFYFFSSFNFQTWFLRAACGSLKFFKLVKKKKKIINHPVWLKTINTVCSCVRRYRPASVPHISITWNKWNRAWKSHACSAMEMRGQLSLRYQFWTDGLPWGAVSPFQLKIRNSHCLNRHVKNTQMGFVCVRVSLSLLFNQWSCSLAIGGWFAVVLGGSHLESACKRAF